MFVNLAILCQIGSCPREYLPHHHLLPSCISPLPSLLAPYWFLVCRSWFCIAKENDQRQPMSCRFFLSLPQLLTATTPLYFGIYQCRVDQPCRIQCVYKLLLFSKCFMMNLNLQNATQSRFVFVEFT